MNEFRPQQQVSHTLHEYESFLLIVSYLDICLLSYLLWLPISHVQSTMAESTPTYVSELVNHMKGLTVMDEETLLDLAVEHVADVAARQLGLKQGKGREREGFKNPSHRAKAKQSDYIINRI